MKPRPRKRYATIIDATELFESEQLRNFEFGEVDVEEVQVCEMGVKDVDGEIRYKSVGGFNLTAPDGSPADVIVGGLDEIQDNASHALETTESMVIIDTEK